MCVKGSWLLPFYINFKNMKKALGPFITVLILAVPLICMDAFLLMKLYNWFVVSVYELNTLSFIQCLGLAFFLSFVKFKFTDNHKPVESLEIVKQFFIEFLFYAFILLEAWILYLIIM